MSENKKVEMDELKHKILVYGTLRKGCGNNRLMTPRGSVLLDTVTVPGYVMHSAGGFPYCLPVDDKECSIVGEIYHVSDLVLASLDRLEGLAVPGSAYGGHYSRDPVIGIEGVEMYIPVRKESALRLPRMESGDWMKDQPVYDWY